MSDVKFTNAPVVVQVEADWSKGALDPNSDADSSIQNFTSEQRVKFYSDNAIVYDKDMQKYSFRGPVEAAEATHRILKDNPSAHIIDIGGGTGQIVVELRKLGPYNNVDGLDAAKGMLDIAAEKKLYNEIIHQYFHLESGLPHNKYDAAVCSGAFVAGHLKSDAMIELCNIVKPGGYVIVTMRHEHLDTVEEYKNNMRSVINSLIEQNKWKTIEDRTFPNWCFGDTDTPIEGHLFVHQKL